MADRADPSAAMPAHADEARAPHAAAEAAVAATSAPAAAAAAGGSPQPALHLEALHASLLAHLDSAFAASSPSESPESFILRAMDAQLVEPAVQRLHTLVLPTVAAFEWSRRRDLPPILTKKIVRASPAVFMVQAQLGGMMRDAFQSAHGPLRRSMARHLCAHTLLHAATGVKEVYLSLVVSRFHSRQLFVDLASMLSVMRSFAQALRAASISDGSSGSGSASPFPLLSSSADSALQQVDVELLELACATVVTHPTLMSLDDIARLLQGWEQHWNAAPAAAAADATCTSASAAAAPTIDMSVLAQQLGELWLCEPFALPHCPAPLPPASAAADSAGAQASSAPSSPPAPPPSFLDSFFALPRARQTADADSTSAGTSSPFHWIGQDLPLSNCSPLPLLLDESLVLRHLSPARLLRLVSMWHELRVDDFPELTEEQEQRAAAVRASVLRLQAAWRQH